MPCTPARSIDRSPVRSDRYSDSSVVWKVKGAPSATDQPSARSTARPLTSWCTAKLALMPAPFTVAPCTYSARTDGPIPLGHTAMTSIPEGNSCPTPDRWPSRKPWDSPKVAPGRNALNTCGKSSACAASEMSSSTTSESEMTWNISPRVPSSSVNPAARAAGADDEDSRRPTTTLTAPCRESRRFCACAGPGIPADDRYLVDALEGGGQPVEEVPPAPHDRLAAAAQSDVFLVENRRLEVKRRGFHDESFPYLPNTGGPRLKPDIRLTQLKYGLVWRMRAACPWITSSSTLFQMVTSSIQKSRPWRVLRTPSVSGPVAVFQDILHNSFAGLPIHFGRLQSRMHSDDLVPVAFEKRLSGLICVDESRFRRSVLGEESERRVSVEPVHHICDGPIPLRRNGFTRQLEMVACEQ